MAGPHSLSDHTFARFRRRDLIAQLCANGSLIPWTASGQDIELAPIHYSVATAENAGDDLQARLATGEVTLEHDEDHGHVESLLHARDVPESNQVLVFSKTSPQRNRITPKTPRAIYFDDDVMVGYCLPGGMIEISAADDAPGSAYDALDQAAEEKPRPMRQTESCLLCHSSSTNKGIPGHLARSVFVDRRGLPLLASGSYRTDHVSPLDERGGDGT